jgi:peptidyl-prolyl cis-trans isomerase C
VAFIATPASYAVTASAPTNSATAKLTELFGDPVIAKGKGVEVKRSQLDSAMISIKSTAAARGQNIPPEQMTLLERQVLERLIQIQLLLGQATDADKAKGQEATTKRLEAILKRAGSEEALTRQLKSVGLTQDELKSKMLEEATAEAVLERELKVVISDEAVKKFYEDNPSRFEEPEMVRASHVLIGTRDQTTGTEMTDAQKKAKRTLAEDVLKKAKAGDDFAKLAKEYSDDPGSKDKGGEYTFPRGQMVPEFESAAFSLNTNQVSDIVTTQFGYHIIKLSEKIPAQKVPLTKVSDDLKEGLKQQEMQKQMPDFFDKLKAGANIEITDEKLKAAKLETPPASPKLAPPSK